MFSTRKKRGLICEDQTKIHCYLDNTVKQPKIFPLLSFLTLLAFAIETISEVREEPGLIGETGLLLCGSLKDIEEAPIFSRKLSQKMMTI